MRIRTLYEVRVDGKSIQSFTKSQKAFELKSDLEDKGFRPCVKKVEIEARP